MPQTIPFGVKYSRVINFIAVAFIVFLGIFATVVASPVLTEFLAKHSPDGMGNMTSSGRPGLILTIFYGLVCLIPIVLLIMTNRGLLKLRNSAKVLQIIILILFLFLVPIGTILYGISLYFMLFDKKTKEAFALQT